MVFSFDALMSYDEKANIGMTVYSDVIFQRGETYLNY